MEPFSSWEGRGIRAGSGDGSIRAGEGSREENARGGGRIGAHEQKRQGSKEPEGRAVP